MMGVVMTSTLELMRQTREVGQRKRDDTVLLAHVAAIIQAGWIARGIDISGASAIRRASALIAEAGAVVAKQP